MSAARIHPAAGAVIVLAAATALLSPGPILMGAAAALLAAAVLLGSAPAAQGARFAGMIAALVPARHRAVARVAVVLTAPLAGVGPALYAVAALAVALRGRPDLRPPADWRTAAGTGFVGLAALVAADAAGLTLAGAGVLWCVVLPSAGLPLFWSTRSMRGAAPLADARLIMWLGVILVIAGTGVILDRAGAFGLDTSALLGGAAVLCVLAFVLVPRWLRVQRQLEAERGRREREQERAEIGDMLHDSVLQTLALIQRRDDVPTSITAVARRQERELRDWLVRGEAPARAARTLDEGLRAAVAAIEDDHGVGIDTVVVGDTPLTPPAEALVAAAREAVLNAVKHGDGSPVSVFAKVEDRTASVFVRDRGPGFDPAAVDPARRGLRVSILGRMERVGGDAEVVAAPGDGCEVIVRVRV